MDHESAMAGGGGPARTRGRPKLRSDAAQRESIILAARDMFIEAGYGTTTMDAVAARCGISKRTLYRLFPAKTDLFRAIIVQHRNTMLALPRPDDDLPLEQALAEIFRVEMDESEDRDRMAFLWLVVTESVRFPEVEEMIKSAGAGPSRDMLGQWLARQKERGLIAIGDPRMAARMLMEMIFGVFVRRFPGDEELSREDRRRHALACIGVFLNGVRA